MREFCGYDIIFCVNYQSFADKSLNGEALTQEEARAVLSTPFFELEELLSATRRVREHYFSRRVKVCVLALSAANSLFVDGYLTEPGDASNDVRTWIEKARFEVEGPQVPVAA